MTDRLDDELQRLRADLHASATATADPAAALADLRSGSRLTVLGTRRRNDRLAVIGAALLIAASLVAVAVIGDSGRKVVQPITSSTPVTSATATTSVSATTVTMTSPSVVPTPFADASSVSFIDPENGFGVMYAGSNRSAVFRTSDGGNSWQSSGFVDGVGEGAHLTFADATNGWLTTSGGVWSTHDAGQSWRSITTPSLLPLAPMGVVADSVNVYAVGRSTAPDGRFIVYSAPVNSDDFSATRLQFDPGAGPVFDFSIAASTGKVWVVYNDRVFTGGGRIDGAVSDSQWKPPAWDQGGALRVVTARDAGPIYTFGLTGVWTDVAVANVASVSTDGGATFRRLPLPPVSSTGPQPDTVEIVPIDAHTVGAVVTRSDGSATTLLRSTNLGANWSKVAAVAVTDIRFIDATTAIATSGSPDYGIPQAVRSNDGGRTWAPLGTPPTVTGSIPTATVAPDLSYDLGALSFSNLGNGWLLTSSQEDQRTTLFRTTDLGRHWVVAPTLGVPGGARPYGVAFADLQNGWLWGDGWWATHDGGSTWHALPANAAGVTPNQVIVTGGYAFALSADATGVFSVMRSPVAVDDFVDTGLAWEKGAGGNEVSLSIVSQGSSVFAAFNDRGGRTGRILGTRADPTWTPTGAGRGGNIDFATAPGGQDLYLATQTGIWGGDAVSQLIVERSPDGGNTFIPLTLPVELTVADKPLRFCGLRAPEAGTVVVLGCDANGTVLIASADGGHSWRPTITLPADAFDVQLLTPQFITYRTGGQPTALMVSSDSGITFQRSFPPAP